MSGRKVKFFSILDALVALVKSVDFSRKKTQITQNIWLRRQKDTEDTEDTEDGAMMALQSHEAGKSIEAVKSIVVPQPVASHQRQIINAGLAS